MKIEEQVEIARPPEDVYAVIADLGRGPEWQPSLVRVDVARRKEVRRIGGQEREASFDVPGRWIVQFRTREGLNCEVRAWRG